MCVSLAVVSFFLPWASIELHEPAIVSRLKEVLGGEDAADRLTGGLSRITASIQRGTETISGTLPTLADIPREVSGVQIPRIAGRKNVQVVVALFELFTNARQGIRAKSYAVYLVPGLAVLCGVLLMRLGGSRRAALGIGAVCAVIAAAGFWKLLTTDTTMLIVTMHIGAGLWLTLWAYAGLSLLAVARIFIPSGRDSI